MNRPIQTPITPPPATPPTAAEAVSVRGVSFGYSESSPTELALSGVSVGLKPGRLTAVLGPNASGKSTLIKMMLNQLRPWSGAVEIGGRPARRWGGRALARRVSYVPQRGGASFAFTVRQTIAMGRFAFGDEKFVDDAIEKIGLADVAERSFHELSGGQQQRVLIARAWAQSRPPEMTAPDVDVIDSGTRSDAACRADVEPRILLADEPASGLDLRHAHEAMALFREMADEGMAVLVVLHGLDLATRWADEAWLMDRGRVVAQGPAAEVLLPGVLGPVYGVEMDRVDHGGRHFLTVK